MADQPGPPHHPQKWWQSAPGFLTAGAAFLAAASGLIGGLNQLGAFDRFKRPSAQAAAPAVHLSDTLAGTAGALRRPVAPRMPAPRARVTRPSAQPSSVPSAPSRDQPAETAAAPSSSPPAPAPSTPPQSAPAPSPAPAPAGPTGVLPSGTMLELASTSRVCSTTSQPGDHFGATVVVPVTGQGGASVPIGSTMLLETTKEAAPTFIGARPDSLDVGGKSFPAAGSARPQRELTAGASQTGFGVGACIPAGGHITVTLTSPLQFSHQ